MQNMMDVMMLTQEGMGAREYNYERTLSSRTQNPKDVRYFCQIPVLYTHTGWPNVVQRGP